MLCRIIEYSRFVVHYKVAQVLRNVVINNENGVQEDNNAINISLEQRSVLSDNRVPVEGVRRSDNRKFREKGRKRVIGRIKMHRLA